MLDPQENFFDPGNAANRKAGKEAVRQSKAQAIFLSYTQLRSAAEDV